MVPAESLSSVSEQMASEHRPAGELLGGSGIAVTASAAHRRSRTRICDLDRATCRTRLSQRQFLIQLQADSANGLRGELDRFRGSTLNNQWSCRVVDWD